MVVDPPEVNREVVRALGLGYPILADPTLAAIDAYGLRHRDAHDGRDIALSASILIDDGGVVRWRSVAQNFRVRPTPAIILAALDALGTPAR